MFSKILSWFLQIILKFFFIQLEKLIKLIVNIIKYPIIFFWEKLNLFKKLVLLITFVKNVEN